MRRRRRGKREYERFDIFRVRRNNRLRGGRGNKERWRGNEVLREYEEEFITFKI